MGGSALNPGTSRLGKLAFEFVLYIAAAVLTPLILGMIFFALLPSPIEGWIAVPLAVLSCLFVLASIGQKKFPITTFGKKKAIEESEFLGENERCAECDAEIDRGIYREFSEQFVVFGCPIYTTESGQNPYCPWCADGLRSPLSGRTDQSSHEKKEAEGAMERSEKNSAE